MAEEKTFKKIINVLEFFQSSFTRYDIKRVQTNLFCKIWKQMKYLFISRLQFSK